MLSRTVGLPQSTDDIGNWLQPLGLASLFVEISLIALTSYMLAVTQPVRHARALRPVTATAA